MSIFLKQIVRDTAKYGWFGVVVISRKILQRAVRLWKSVTKRHEMRHKTMRMRWVPNWLTATVVSYNLADVCTLTAHKLWKKKSICESAQGTLAIGSQHIAVYMVTTNVWKFFVGLFPWSSGHFFVFSLLDSITLYNIKFCKNIAKMVQKPFA